ncbi:MAG: sugar-binding protein [Firmicutes bacterium]|nr:sugar-binding protein [Bacillota bacterium]
MFKKLFTLSLIVATLLITACGDDGGGSGDAGFIGISMPTQSSQRWIDDGNNLVEQLQALGFRTTLQFAEDIVQNQINQIENMITQGVDVLVIASVDGGALTSVLAQAAAQNIPIIAYDRLITGTEHVNYYTTFDNFQVGVMKSEFIVGALGINAGATGPFNIELFAGSPDDNNAFLFFDGSMSVLQPLIDSGVLVVRSGQTDVNQVATLRWDGALAQNRMDSLLSAFYTDARVDAVLSPFDGISIGIISSLRGSGYGTDAQPWPVITGQDAELPSVRSIIAGEQAHTIFKDTRLLAAAAVEMVQALLAGEPAPVNDTTTYHNGIFVVPSYLLPVHSVDINNWYEILIESGYYSMDDI